MAGESASLCPLRPQEFWVINMTRNMFQGMFGIDGKGLLAWETLVESRWDDESIELSKTAPL